MLKTKTVCFDYADKPAALTLSECSGRMSVRRGFLSIQGGAANDADIEKGVDVAIDVLFMRHTMYPDMLGAVVTVENIEMPKTPDEFIHLLEALPEAVVSEWNAAVYELNPHWRESEGTDEEKKSATSAEMTSTGG